MKDALHVVKDSKTGQSFEFTVATPEGLDEAIATDGELTVFQTYIAGRKVRIDNIARNAFRPSVDTEGNEVPGKTREEVEALIAEYKPGQSRMSKEKMASQAIVDNSALIFKKKLTADITAAFVAKDYEGVMALIAQAKGE